MGDSSFGARARRLGAAAAAAAALAILAAPQALAEGGPELSGSSELFSALGLGDGRLGLSSVSRLVLEARPSERASFRAEASLELDYGALSAFAAAEDAGLAAAAELPPGVDPRRDFSLDQAYATLLAGPLDLRAGIVPIAWGSAYAFNPTSRVAPPRSPWDAEETEVGSPGLDLCLSLPRGLALELYAAFSDRSKSLWPSLEEGDPELLPWGAKLQYRGSGFDISIGALREIMSFGDAGGDSRSYWACADAVGSLGELDLYAEAALRIDGPSFPDWEEGLEAAAGLAWALPLDGATLRLEYARLGSGGAGPEDYDWAALLAGTAVTLGRDYLLAALEREEADRWSVSGGLLANLDDGSLAAAAEAAFRPEPEIELSLRCILYRGERGDEFDGRFEAAPGAELDLARPLLGIGLRMDF
ncbi:MAG TPA: hypothetical protein PLB91_01325 [Spirochaetales bacterium]|nr:hypothetical protein [Spirochaetales bacterium]